MSLHSLRHGLAFWLHLAVTLLAWVAPFWFSWYLIIPVYAAVLLQFALFGRCLMNREHALNEEDDATFYSFLLEKAGFELSRSRVKLYVRRILYPVLSVVAMLWQIVLGFPPLFF